MKFDRRVEAILADRIGLDPESVGPGLIARAALARMDALGITAPGPYADLLVTSPEEQDELIEEVVIPESWFFRDERPFRRVRELACAGWLSDATRPPLRVLSLPCAAGEEPYSLAMTLLEAGLAPGRWTVVGVDVSARVLQRARAGRYGRGALRSVSSDLMAKYIRPGPEGFDVAPEVRGMVRFVRGNLLDRDLLRNEPAFDVVFCRNLLIYFDAGARRIASENLNRLLAPQGELYLGHSERLDVEGKGFENIGDPGCFAFRRRTDSGPAPPAHPLSRPLPLGLPKPRQACRAGLPTPSPSPLVAAERDRGASQRPAAPVAPPLASPADLLEQARDLADQGRTAEAAALCERRIREAGPSAPALFLLGMIRQASGDYPDAEALLRKAIYLEPGHDEALLALALLADRRGDPASAEAYRRRAGRARSRREV